MKNLRFLAIAFFSLISASLFAQPDQIFARVGNMPTFPGCEDRNTIESKQLCSDNLLRNYVQDNVVYPESAKKENLSGIVTIQFIVKNDGEITNAEVTKSLSPDCDAAAIRVIESMNNMEKRWQAGAIRDKKVSVRLELQVYFGDVVESLVEEEVDLETPDILNPPSLPPIEEEWDGVFTIVDVMPIFPGCETLEDEEERKLCTEKNLLKYMYQNIKYPTIARENGIEGLVVLQFVIKEDGSVSNTQVLRGIGGGCDEESVRVIESMNELPQKWTPGKQKGQAVKVRYNFPIRFKLAESDLVRKTIPKDEIFLEVDEMPIFPGCQKVNNQDDQKNCSDRKMKTYIEDNVVYPLDALENNIEGSVVAQFLVTETGKVVNIKIIKSLSKSCDAEAFRVINSMNNMSKSWIPGIHKRQKVKVQYTVPIYFNLSSMSEKEKRKLMKKLKKGS